MAFALSQPAHGVGGARVSGAVAVQDGGGDEVSNPGDRGDLSVMNLFLKEILTEYGVSHIS